jgi:tetratricopeptide (TPR) repeat protein
MSPLRYVSHRAWAMLLLATGQHDAAARVFDAMMREFPQEAYPMASRAHLHVQAGDKTQAIELLSQLTHRFPDQAAHWFNLGFLQEQQAISDAELEAALASFSRACELRSDLDRAWYGKGLTLIRLKRYDEAVSALKKNTQLQPMSPYGWYQLARVHMDRQQPDEARKIIRHLKGFEPKVAAQLERETGIVVSPAN